MAGHAALTHEPLGGGFELIVSTLLLAELERALAHPKLRKRIAAEDPSDPPPIYAPAEFLRTITRWHTREVAWRATGD